MAYKQRISYLPLEAMDDEMRAEMARCQREGTPRPESSAVRAHVPAAFWAFAHSWEAIFRNGVCDHAIKELCRVYVSRSVKCEYCGNQRSEQARAHGLTEGKYDDLLNFETWERLHRHFSEPELVELGCFIALTMGQQSWLRLLDIEHHEVLEGTAASMAPGFGTAEELAAAKAAEDYWARKTAAS